MEENRWQLFQCEISGSLCLFLYIYRIYYFLKYGNTWLWKCLKRHNWGIAVLSTMFLNQRGTHYSVTVKWNLYLSPSLQRLVWKWKNALIRCYFCWNLSFRMCHLGCWLLGWESIKQAVLHQWRTRWRSPSSPGFAGTPQPGPSPQLGPAGLLGLISVVRYLTDRDKS